MKYFARSDSFDGESPRKFTVEAENVRDALRLARGWNCDPKNEQDMKNWNESLAAMEEDGDAEIEADRAFISNEDGLYAVGETREAAQDAWERAEGDDGWAD